MASFKTVLAFMVTGAWLGGLFGTIGSGKFSAWYNTPGAAGSLCDCAKTSHEVASHVVTGHLAGTGVGALVFMGLGIAWVRARKTRDARKAAEEAARVASQAALAASNAAEAARAASEAAGIKR